MLDHTVIERRIIDASLSPSSQQISQPSDDWLNLSFSSQGSIKSQVKPFHSSAPSTLDPAIFVEPLPAPSTTPSHSSVMKDSILDDKFKEEYEKAQQPIIDVSKIKEMTESLIKTNHELLKKHDEMDKEKERQMQRQQTQLQQQKREEQDLKIANRDKRRLTTDSTSSVATTTTSSGKEKESSSCYGNCGRTSVSCMFAIPKDKSDLRLFKSCWNETGTGLVPRFPYRWMCTVCVGKMAK